MKICNSCRIELPLTEFFKRGDGKSGYRSKCKRCHNGAINIICPVCLKEHSRHKTKRVSSICETCYPYYRVAYNLVATAKYRANKAKLDFNLDPIWAYKQVILPCPMTGLNYSLEKNGNNYSNRNPLTPTIDKKNPTLGYTKDNCRIVCWWYNVSKQRFTDEEVINFCKQVLITSEIQFVPNVDQWDVIDMGIT